MRRSGDLRMIGQFYSVFKSNQASRRIYIQNNYKENINRVSCYERATPDLCFGIGKLFLNIVFAKIQSIIYKNTLLRVEKGFLRVDADKR